MKRQSREDRSPFKIYLTAADRELIESAVESMGEHAPSLSGFITGAALTAARMELDSPAGAMNHRNAEPASASVVVPGGVVNVEFIPS